VSPEPKRHSRVQVISAVLMALAFGYSIASFVAEQREQSLVSAPAALTAGFALVALGSLWLRTLPQPVPVAIGRAARRRKPAATSR
jgi:hypothetical protein